MTAELTRHLLLGRGRVGGALALALGAAGDEARQASLREAWGPERLAGVELVWLTVPDGALADAATALAERLGEARPAVVHCSGASSSELLAPLAALGCPTGSAHPLQTFPDPQRGAEALPGALWALEGADALLAGLEGVVGRLGGRSWRIAAADKVRYHASAVLACNGLVALLAQALDLLASVGMPQAAAREAMAPMLRAGLEATLASGPAAALTGPAMRGDAGTVAAHLAALADAPPATQQSYRALTRRMLDLAELPAETRDALEALLAC